MCSFHHATFSLALLNEIIILSSTSQIQQLFIVEKVLQTGVRYLVIEGIGLGLSGYGGGRINPKSSSHSYKFQ